MKGMTNNQIIMNEAAKLDPATLHAIATAHHTPEQIAAMAANAVTTDENGDEQPATIADVEIILAAAELHTFDHWKKEGKSVKKGETHLIECYLWKYTTRPSKAQREAAEAEGKEAAPAPHFYPTKSHLFSCLQVHDAKQAPAGRFGSVAAIMEYNKKLAAERKAAKAAAEQTASTPAPIITEEHHELPELVHVDPLPTKKASKPAATKKPAPDALRKAEREAKAAFLAVPETDRKGQAAALDAWRKTRKAVEDAKQAPAAVAAPDEAPVKQLDFESIAAGLNVKKITAYLKGQAKSRNAVRITCQSGSVYIITGYAAFKLPAILYRDVIQPVTMQDAPADGVTIVSSDAGFVVNDPHQLTAAQMFQKFSACKEEVKRTSILQEVEAKGKVWGTFRMFRNGSRPIMINSEYDAFVDHHEFVYHGSNNPLSPILATDTADPKRAAVAVLIAPMKANDEIQQVCNRLFA